MQGWVSTVDRKSGRLESRGWSWTLRVWQGLRGSSFGMSRYIRPRIPGASVFFTAALADRSKRTLVAEIEALRDAVRKTKAERPFRIDARVVLHAICTPSGPCRRAIRTMRPGGG